MVTTVLKKKEAVFLMDEIAKIRNIGIIAHIDAGKTTTTERFLFYTGKTYKIGEVDEGTATMDWMDQEKERGITITSAATTCFWKGYKRNIIDTPGHIDIAVEVERSLRVLDGAIGIFCGVSGVQPQSESVWRQSEKYGVPRIIYINKMDRIGADFFKVIKSIEKKLGTSVIVMQIPIGEGSSFEGIIDILEEKAIYYPGKFETESEIKEIPDAFVEIVKKYKEEMIEKVAEVDEKIMEKYIKGEEIKKEELKKGIRKTTLARKFFPIFCGSSLKDKGTMFLLDAIVDYLPSPIDRGEIIGQNPISMEIEKILPLEKHPLSLLIFKVYNDIHLGRISYARIYSGVLKQGERIYNWTRKRKEKVLRILEIHANKYTEIKQAKAGDIVGLIGLKESFTGDTLGIENKPIVFEPIIFPEPVVSVAVEPKIKSEQSKVYEKFLTLTEEDPTVKVKTDSETGQIIVSGMGELHIEVLVERLRREHNLQVKLGKPEVAYRETISTFAKGEGKFIKQTGGKGHYGHVIVKIEPLPKGEKFKFVNMLEGEKIPIEFVPAIEEGIKEAIEVGVFGYPIIDVKVSLIDGSSHSVDSNEVAYRIAATMAFKDAYKKAKPVLLEPIMKIEVTTPEEFLGEVLGDLNARKMKIENVESYGNTKIIKGLIPLRNVFGYTTSLRSLTQGRGSNIIEPLYYEQVPEEELSKIIQTY